MPINWTEYVVKKDCDQDIYKIVNAMLESLASSILLERWSTLAMNLSLPYLKIKKWRTDLLCGKIEDIQPLLHEIIIEWAALNSTNAKLSVLAKALSDAGLKVMADKIKIAFEDNLVDQQELFPRKHKLIPEGLPVGELDFLVYKTPFDVQVTRPLKATKNCDDFYKLPYRFKGYALIINMTKFLYPTPNRDGASNDIKYMKELWKQLGDDTVVHEGKYNVHEFETIVTNFIEKLDEDEDEVKSCVAFIGSHGNFGEILTWDNVPINVHQSFVYPIATCNVLKGKPKLFIIQACQEFTPRTSHDRVVQKTNLKIPVDDTIVCLSTIPGELSNRDYLLGSWYVNVLTRVIMNKAHHMDLEEMIKHVQETMRRIMRKVSKDSYLIIRTWD